MKLRVISALVGVLVLATSASATMNRLQFQAKVAKFTGGSSLVRGVCVCKEAGNKNKAGFLISMPSPGSPGYTGVLVT